MIKALPYIVVIVITLVFAFTVYQLFAQDIVEWLGTHHFNTSRAITFTKRGHALLVSPRNQDEFDLMMDYALRYGQVEHYPKSSNRNSFRVKLSDGYSRYGVKRDLARQYDYFIKELQRLEDKND